jgi:hypothetical protein
MKIISVIFPKDKNSTRKERKKKINCLIYTIFNRLQVDIMAISLSIPLYILGN